MAGIPWGLDGQNSHYPQEFDRRLWHRGGTLDASAKNLKKILSKFEGKSRGFLTQSCHMGRELDSIFPNCVIPWGDPYLPFSGGKH